MQVRALVYLNVFLMIVSSSFMFVLFIASFCFLSFLQQIRTHTTPLGVCNHSVDHRLHCSFQTTDVYGVKILHHTVILSNVLQIFLSVLYQIVFKLPVSPPIHIRARKHEYVKYYDSQPSL